MIVHARNSPQPPSRPVVSTDPDLAVDATALQPNRADRAVSGGQSKPLTRDQKTALVMLSKQAFDRVQHSADIGDFDTWRQNEAITACGRRISEARNEHFSVLKSHFLNLAGEAGRAFHSAMRAGTEDTRLAMAALERSCAERGLRLDYPAAICWRQYKCKLDSASAKQLWQLNFTVRNRRKVAPQPSAERSAEGRRPTNGRDYVLHEKPQSNNPF